MLVKVLDKLIEKLSIALFIEFLVGIISLFMHIPFVLFSCTIDYNRYIRYTGCCKIT